MLASAVAAGLSPYLHWLPCRGSMLLGSIIQGDDSVGGTFSDLCLRRMDGDQGPWGLALYVLAMVLAGVAWLTLVFGLRWQRWTKRVAALPGLATLALAGASATGDAVFGQDGEILWTGRCVRLTPLGPWCSNPSGRTKDSRAFPDCAPISQSRRQSGTERGLHLAGGRGGNGTATSEAS